MGPWSSRLTLEADGRFPHAEEVAGSNPAGPTKAEGFAPLHPPLSLFLEMRFDLDCFVGLEIVVGLVG